MKYGIKTGQQKKPNRETFWSPETFWNRKKPNPETFSKIIYGKTYYAKNMPKIYAKEYSKNN